MTKIVDIKRRNAGLRIVRVEDKEHDPVSGALKAAIHSVDMARRNPSQKRTYYKNCHDAIARALSHLDNEIADS